MSDVDRRRGLLWAMTDPTSSRSCRVVGGVGRGSRARRVGHDHRRLVVPQIEGRSRCDGRVDPWRTICPNASADAGSSPVTTRRNVRSMIAMSFHHDQFSMYSIVEMRADGDRLHRALSAPMRLREAGHPAEDTVTVVVAGHRLGELFDEVRALGARSNE